ncbi:FecR family protein [Pedobacter sp. MC2016-24]|uniref:FecR family protein n=1 Tax=Pedobacter sp. MC2016-24 TaxID=2780090 RepID=UPI0018826F73|nr:FecR family protein [Pedobacter sp. MC2016-24]MBE9600951.1 FecR domain-containing protein [Pedobacter sp. MC2016-24]
MKQQDLKKIFNNIKSGTASPKEIASMKQWLHQFNLEADVDLSVKEVKQIQSQIWQNMAAELNIQSSKTHMHWIRYASAAAAVLIGLMLFLFHRPGFDSRLSLNNPTVRQDKLPGSIKAHVTLADGTSINIDEANKQSLLNTAGIKIKKAKDGTVIYKLSAEKQVSSSVKYSTIYTPKGGRFNLELPDGTLVMLNASSSFTYPTVFDEQERSVELSGEAFFHVSKQHKAGKNIPFYVKTLRQKIEVLGTQFNVSSYADDDFTATTLLEGKVRVNMLNGADLRILAPGEQSVLTNSSNSIRVSRVNVESTVAWKDGQFLFEDAYLKEILLSLSRWYDVKVNLNNLPKTRYTIFISRESKLSSVLKMLDKTGDLKFKLINNTIEIN